MKDIAEKAGVSQATVSRVLNNQPSVTPAKRKRIMELVRELDFEPNYPAKVLAASSSQLIGVVLPDMQNPYFTDILFHIERIANLNGYNILVCNSNGDLQKEKSLIRTLKARQVDGLLIGFADSKSEMIHTLRNDTLKVVGITQDYPGFDCVAISHKMGGQIAAEHLISQKVEDFVFFGNEGDEKYIGFREQLTKTGIKEDNIHIIENEDWFFHTIQRGYRIVKNFIETYKPKGKLGVFAISDIYAAAVLQAAKYMNFSVPEEISIVGFNNIFLCEAVEPNLTSISQPVEEIASIAVDILLKKIDGSDEKRDPKHVILQPSLIKRGT